MIVILFSLSFFLCWIILHLEGHEYIYEKWTANWKDKPNFLTYKKMAKPPSPCLNGSLLWSVFSTGNKNIHCRGTTMKFCSALLWKKKGMMKKSITINNYMTFAKYTYHVILMGIFIYYVTLRVSTSLSMDLTLSISDWTTFFKHYFHHIPLYIYLL